MASYGAKYLQWAQFAAEAPDESAEAFPKYQAPVNLGGLVAVNEEEITVEAKLFFDNRLGEHSTEFQELSIDAEISELNNTVAAAIFGAHIGEDQSLEFGEDDNAPYGGLGFIVSKKVNGAKVYQGIVYPKVKASPKGHVYNTKGQSIAFATEKVHFTGTTCAKGKHTVKSKDFPTEAEAKSWLDGIIKATV